MVFALASVIAQIQFQGGDASSLAAALEKATGSPAVVAAYRPSPIPAIEFESTDRKSLLNALKPKGYLLPANMDLAVFPAEFARWKIQLSPLMQNRFSHMEAEIGQMVSNQKVSVRTKPGSYINLARLSDIGFSKPVTVHWLYQDIPVAASVSNATEIQFLELVSKAVGALVFNDRDGYKISPDAKEIQYRTLLTIQNLMTPEVLKNTDKSEVDRVNWLKFAISAATNAQIIEAFQSPSSSTRIPLNKQQKQNLYAQMSGWESQTGARIPRGGGGQKEEILINIEQGQTTRVRGRGANYDSIRRRTDFNQPMYVRLNANFTVGFEGESLANGNGQRVPIRF